MRMRRRHPILAILLLILLLAGVGLTMPWAFHIGGRWTPLLTWNGTGTLHTKSGNEYPIWISFSPSRSSSRLALDGLRPSGGLKGMGCLCMSPDATQQLTLEGTFFKVWSTTENSLIEFRLHE